MEKLPQQQITDGERRAARKRLAEGFLSVLHQAIQQQEPIDKDTLLAWLKQYKQEHAGEEGSDFEAGHVYGVLFDRLYGPFDPDNGNKPRVVPALDEQALELIENLDLGAIDQRLSVSQEA